MNYSSKYINQNYRIKVYGVLEDGSRINKLLGVSGTIELIGVTLFNKFLDRAERAMADSCTCKIRRGIRITLYAK